MGGEPTTDLQILARPSLSTEPRTSLSAHGSCPGAKKIPSQRRMFAVSLRVTIMTTLQFTRQAARKLDSVYASPDIVAQRGATLQCLAVSPGEAVIDIGCGPGFLSLDIAAAVGSTGRVLGIDISEDILRLAGEKNGCSWVTFRRGDATTIEVPDANFDAVVCVQVLEYIVDVDRALAEMIRVLKPGGRALIIDTDWDGVVWYSDNADRMARVLDAWASHCPHPGLPRTLAPRLSAVGFDVGAVTGYPIINTHGDEESYSHGLMDLIVDFVGKQGSVDRGELMDWAAEQETIAAESRYFFSTLRCLFRATKPCHRSTYPRRHAPHNHT